MSTSAPTLVELLGNQAKRPAVIAECATLIDAHVKQKGFVIKSAYAVIKGLKKGFINETVDALLDDWLGKIQPHYEKWRTTSGPASPGFADYVTARSEDVAEALLNVTDVRAERTSHTTAKKMYFKMREGAKKNVIEAIPDLSRMIEGHLPPR